MYLAAASIESISAVSDLFGAMVQAGAALVAIVGGVVGARYVAVHTRRHELAVDIDGLASQAHSWEFARHSRDFEVAQRAGKRWAWRPDRLRQIASGRFDDVWGEIEALPETAYKSGAVGEVLDLKSAFTRLSPDVATFDGTIEEWVQNARLAEVSPVGALAVLAAHVDELSQFDPRAASLAGAREQLVQAIATQSQVLDEQDAIDEARLAEAEAYADAASSKWQDRHTELIALSKSGEYGVALKVLGMTTLITVVVPLAVMIVRPGDSLALRLVGAVVFLVGVGCLARYLWIYARFLMSPDDTMRLPSGFWRLMVHGAQPVPRDEASST